MGLTALTSSKRRPSGVNLTPEARTDAKQRFLEAYAETGIMRSACEAIGVSRQAVWGWQEHDEEFSAAFNQARALADDALRKEIHRRGVEGVEKPIFYKGHQVATVREYSDTLLIFQAKARMPEYRDQSKIEHTGELTISLADIAAIRARAGN